MEPRYPDAPWHTHGRAIFQPFLVRASSLRLPEGFAPRLVGGRAIGLLGLVEYVAPSPLTYCELVWMPCFVRARGAASGYFVEKMYVDSEASLRGGRELWALPKQIARFEWGEREARVETEDGARLVLDVALRGPAMRAPSDVATVQDAGDALVRFRGSGRATVRSAHLRVREARGLDGWSGWRGATRIRGAGAALVDFAITMHPPKRVVP
ncbi:acetoacetate decarboxylase family protein [Sandaracinus amylolyticus]|uniref:acetoacetate decarboxylase family protein n=1 Tax=Sandaracinus amylolyticus TaxID=927083 RepID=UPI001F21E9D5|nr:acetoacetate decarboxylase family protein [Sandaracinus amylolyticus]UJR81328.1 Hypothetical protein I5071_33850 [Sandaracinus amylolyticus]